MKYIITYTCFTEKGKLNNDYKSDDSAIKGGKIGVHNHGGVCGSSVILRVLYVHWYHLKD